MNDYSLKTENLLLDLQLAYDNFFSCILSLPDSLLFSEMNGWSPRDVVAHLIGWNRRMIEASSSILNVQTPSYYADAPNDYRNINAQMVITFSSQSKEELLTELESSMKTFRKFIESLPLNDLVDSHGVFHYRGRPATMAGVIQSLMQDDRHHTLEIQQWRENLSKSSA